MRLVLLSLLFSFTLLSGCGQKGPLVLPQEPTATMTTATTVTATTETSSQ